MSWLHDNSKSNINMEESKLAMSAWEAWDENKRKDFLQECNLNINYASHNWNVDLPHDIRMSVINHISISNDNEK